MRSFHPVAFGLMAVLIIFALAACETQVSRPVFPALTYDHLLPIKFDVARVEIVEDFKAPLKAPNVDHLFPTPPLTAVMRWIDDRVRAAGTSGRVRVTVRDASATLVPLETKGGIEGLLNVEPTERLEAIVEVVIEIFDDREARSGHITAQAKRSRTLLEDITLNERDQAYFEITKALMDDLNLAIEQNIRNHLQKFLR